MSRNNVPSFITPSLTWPQIFDNFLLTSRARARNSHKRGDVIYSWLQTFNFNFVDRTVLCKFLTIRKYFTNKSIVQISKFSYLITILSMFHNQICLGQWFIRNYNGKARKFHSRLVKAISRFSYSFDSKKDKK